MIEIKVYNTDFILVAILDNFKSLIWNDRSGSPGDFELYMGYSSDILDWAVLDNLILFSGSPEIMIIESIEIQSSEEDSDYIVIKGRSVESILERRIVWPQMVFSNLAVDEIVYRLITANTIASSDSRRSFRAMNVARDLPESSVRLSTQYTGDNLLEACNETLDGSEFHLSTRARFDLAGDLVGFDIVLAKKTIRGFSSESGVVVFSSEYDNLLKTDYILDSAGSSTTAIVAGVGKGSDRKSLLCEEQYSGLSRREIFVDAKNISDKDSDKEPIPEHEYRRLLESRGRIALSENRIKESFSAEAPSAGSFRYGIDFFVGDSVQVVSEHGLSYLCDITEYIQSYSDTESKSYPVFSKVGE